MINVTFYVPKNFASDCHHLVNWDEELFNVEFVACDELGEVRSVVGGWVYGGREESGKALERLTKDVRDTVEFLQRDRSGGIAASKERQKELLELTRAMVIANPTTRFKDILSRANQYLDWVAKQKRELHK